MRLSPSHQQIIKEAVKRHFGVDTNVWIFGSRVDDQKRGGDIDLYLETSLHLAKDIVEAEIRLLVELKSKLGDQKIDLVINRIDSPENQLIHQVAKRTGIKL